MVRLPEGFQSCLAEIRSAIVGVDGWLTPREVEFLALLAACPVAKGEILEIGSYRGKSAIVLSKAAALADSARITAVDPLPDRGPMLQNANGSASARALLEANLERAGVRDRVDIRQMLSGDLVAEWNRPLRLLWIDGDHTYVGAKIDFDGFAPHLSDGAIIAFHDILSPFACTQVFKECVVDGKNFGPVGFWGSIGWGRYRADVSRAAEHAADKRKLSRRLRPLCGYDRPEGLHRLTKMHYRLRRWFVPHARQEPEEWLRRSASA